MGLYANLSAGDKEKVQELANFVRSFAGELARLGNHGRATAAKWGGTIEGIVGGLDANEVIPDTSSETGAEPLTKEDLTNLVGYLIDASNPADNAPKGFNSNYHRALYVRAVGLGNTLG